MGIQALLTEARFHLDLPMLEFDCPLFESHVRPMWEGQTWFRSLTESLAGSATKEEPWKIYDIKDQLVSKEEHDGYTMYTILTSFSFAPDDDPMDISFALSPTGEYIGDEKNAQFLVDKLGIAPEVSDPAHHVCSIGFCEKEQKWYGWSHRAIHGFGVGDVVKKGDLAASSGYIADYLEQHPEKDRRVPPGFKAKTLEDAKKMAIAFADSVS